MPKLRDTDDIDVDALEQVQYSTEKLTDYAGEVPPIGLALSGYVKKIWWTRTKPKPGGGGDDPMLKVLWIASDNDGDNEEYNDCPFWLNAPLTPGAKFRWDPFLNAYGLTLTDVKTKTYVEPPSKEDQNGRPIQRIGTWKPGADRDEAWCWIVTDQENDDYGLKAIAGEWLPWDEAPEPTADEEPEDVEDEADEDGEPDDEDEYEDEDEEGAEDEDEEPEDEPEPEPPARTRRTRAAATPARSARGSRTASKPATARTRTAGRATGAKPAMARTARSGSRAAPARGKAATPARSTRTKRSGSSQDPPF